MYDSLGISQEADEAGRGWLMLIHQIPPKPDYFRVKVRRRLHQIGAIALKNSVYVLPHTDEAMEDFQWLRREIVEEGGEATLCAAAFVEGIDDEELVMMFRIRSDDEYDEILTAARAAAEAPTEAEWRRLDRRLSAVVGLDFFDAPGRRAAEHAIGEVEAGLARGGGTATPSTEGSGEAVPQGATWVTRIGVHVDRIASAWLIVRFIDAQARFKFVPAKGYLPEPGELRFDMFEGEYTHEGDRCTFETLLTRFGLDDGALRAISEIIHDIDCKDEKFGREEAAGVASVVRGIALAHTDDALRLESGSKLFDELYASFKQPSG